MATHYIILPGVFDGMLDALQSTGLYGDSRDAVLENLVLDQVKHLAGGRGPLAKMMLASAHAFANPPPAEPPPRPGPGRCSDCGAELDENGECPKAVELGIDHNLPF